MDRTRTTPGSARPEPGARAIGEQPAMITAIFQDRDQAERAYMALEERGYSRNDVTVVMSDQTRDKHFSSDTVAGRKTELGTKAAEGAGIGGAIGGTLGALGAAIAAVGTSIALPGLGLVVAGPLAAALAGAGAGAATGGLLGALIGAGIPEERVKKYEASLKQGGILLGVVPRTPEDATYLEREWKRAGGEPVYQ